MKTILFVENDPVVVTMYRNRLQNEGFRIETAEDGLEALRILSSTTPDLVTLDLMLPKLSGADVLRFIRADARLKRIPVILFSNAYMTELGEDAVLSSANKRLLKAYSTPTLLLENIRELLAFAPAENAGAVLATTPTPPATASADAAATDGNGSGLSEKPQVDAGESASPLERQQFLKQARAESVILHDHCRSYVKAPASKEGQQHLIKLHEVVRRLSTNSSRTDCVRITGLMKAFDALLTEVTAKPAWASPSVLQTIAQATDCLDLVLKGEEAGNGKFAAGKVLVVDDDLVCNRVMVSSLKRTNLEPVSVQDPKEGLRLLQGNRFDAILLDVNMPEMTGFELCEQLRRLSHCKTTPVIFVTAYSNFQNRTQGVLSGGDDFITKPVSPLELALKVTIHMLKAHAQRGGAPLPEIQPPTAEVTSNVLQSLAAMQVNQLKTGGASGLEAANLSTLAAGAPTSADATTPPPLPSEFVPAEPQSPVASQPAAPAPTGAAGPVPPNLFLSATETATSTGDAPAETESQPAAAEFSNESLQPVAAVTMNPHQSIGATEVPPAPASEPIAFNAVADTTQPAAPSVFNPFLVETQQPAASQHLLPTASLQNSIVEPQSAARTVDPSSPTLPDMIAFSLPPAPASAIEQTFEPPLPPETLEFLNALNPQETAPLVPTTETQNSFVESPSIPESTPPAINEPVTASDITETPQPAADAQFSLTPNAETETTAAPVAQTPATESLNSVATPGLQTLPRTSVEPVAENVSVAQPQPAASSPETWIFSPEPAAVSPAESPEPVATWPEPVAEAEKSSASSTSAPAPEVVSPTIEVQPTQPESSLLPEAVTTPEVTAFPEVVATESAATEVANTAEVTATSEDTVASTVVANPNSAAPSEPDRVFELIVHSVTRMIYGDSNATVMNLRLVRMALESYKINELVRSAAASNAPQSDTDNH